MQHRNIRILEDLGLNRLEAGIYAFLLTNDPQTGYQIGKKLRKPTANVYKAIESLSHKGAVLIEEGNNRLCRAVPVSEFLEHIESNLSLKLDKARNLWTGLEVQRTDESVYRIESPSLVFERCRTMLQECTNIALLDVFPEALDSIRSAIESGLKRGIQIYIQAYSPLDMPGANVVLPPGATEVLEYWGSQQLNIVIDGKECLLALMSQHLTEVHQAFWSKNLYLSCLLHAGLMQEHTIHQLRLVAGRSGALTAMRQIISQAKFFLNSEIPGQKALYKRFSLPKTADKCEREKLRSI
ncbi:MAG: hypothetical protein OEW48_18045 [Phycisphaerae bacterium]|nr:hypothetical protein [Phycisphaerae bacterium]